MTTQDLTLFKGIAARMSYLNQRQKLLAQNVSNADTPDYRPSDLKPVDFSSLMGNLTEHAKLQPAATNAMHLSPANQAAKPKTQDQKTMYEIAPSGNGVSLEEQMVKETQTTTDYSLMTALYQKNMTMLRTAIGSQ